MMNEKNVCPKSIFLLSYQLMLIFVINRNVSGLEFVAFFVVSHMLHFL